MSDQGAPGRELVNRLETDTRPKEDFDPLFDELAEIVNEELVVQFAMRGFGREIPSPDLDQILAAAVMIANGIDEVFRLERRHPERPTPVLSDEREARLAELKSRIRVYGRQGKQ